MTRVWWFCVTLATAVMLTGGVFAQGDDAPTQVDERIWSQQYWKKMIEAGLVQPNPQVTVPEAVYTGSGINARTVLQDDIPDIPIINATNTTQSETSVFVNPLDYDKALNSNNSTPFPVAGIYGTSGFMTSDAGFTWTGSVQGTGGDNSGDPAAVIDLAGRYFVGYIADNGGNGTAYSTDEGATWTHVQVAPNPGSLADKNHLWVDNAPNSPHNGNLYATWTDFGGANDGNVVVSRSTDNGLTWSTRVNVSNNLPGFHQGVNIQVGPDGTVYAFYTVYVTGGVQDEPAYGVSISTDGGATWGPGQFVIQNTRGIRSTGTSKNHRVNSFPVAAVDISGGSRNGWIYMVWANIGVPGVNQGPGIDIYMIRSTDNAVSWSTPVKVNQDPTGQGNENYFPWLTCDPVTGALSVIFYSDRNVSSTQCEAFVANSIDGGSTWEDFKVSDVAFTPAPIPGLASGYMGDYLAISAAGGKVYPVWADNRTGNVLAYTNPYILADPTDPNGPGNFDVYSDFNTPTSMALSWTDPTTYVNGDTLLPANFTIEIERDGVSIASVAAGTESYTDNGLVDGQLYEYTLFTKDTFDSLSIPVSGSWTAGGSPIPNPPTSFFVTEFDSVQLQMNWTNPSANIDGTPMDDFAGINLYENGNLVATFTRTAGDTGAVDSAVFTPATGTNQYYVTAIDNESPANESVPSGISFSPIRLPFFDDFPTAGDPNAGFWINTTADINSMGVNPPSPQFVLHLDGDPSGGETIELLPVDMSNAQGSGFVLSYWYQPQGTGNAPETADILAVDFLNDQGTWVEVRNYPGTGVVPFVNEVISVDSEDPGVGATFFHPQFQFRFRNVGTTGAFDDWLVDDVFLGEPSGVPTMTVSPTALADTVLVGGSTALSFSVGNSTPTPSTLNFTVTEAPDAPWLSVDPASGTVPSGDAQTVTVNIDATGLASGDYSVDLVVAGNDSTNLEDTVTVSLRVNDAPVVGFTPDSTFFTLNVGDVDSSTLTITNSGLGDLNFTLNDEDLFAAARRPIERRYPENYYGVELPKGAEDWRRGASSIAGSGGPDAFGHRWIDSDEPGGPTFNWVDITGSGTSVSLTDDDFVEVPLPFTFSFYGQAKSSVKISSNGYLTFGTDGTDFSNDAIPDAVDPNDIIAPFWDDLNPADGGTIHYLGTPTEFIVQFTDINHYSGGGEIGTYTFQVILKANGQILFQYLTLTGVVDSQTIGIENSDASDGLEVVFNAAYVHDNLAIRIAADSPWLSANPTFGTVPAGGSMDVQVIATTSGLTDGLYRARLIISSNDPVTPDTSAYVELTLGSLQGPEISVTPDSATADLTPSDSADATLTISNVAAAGSQDLSWSATLVGGNARNIAARITPDDNSHTVYGTAPVSFGPAPAAGDGGDAVQGRSDVRDLLAMVGMEAYGADVFGGAWLRVPLAAPGSAAQLGIQGDAWFAGDIDDAGTFAAIDNSTSNLAVIDTASGAVTILGQIAVQSGHTWTGLTYDVTTATWYAASTNGTTAALYTVDPSGPTSTLVGTSTAVPLLIDIAIDGNGDMYGHDIAADAIFAIDKSSFTATQIGATGFDANFAQGMAFDRSTGDLYLAAYNGASSQAELRLVDLSTGSATLIGPIGTGTGVEVGAFGIPAEGGSGGAVFARLVGTTSGSISAGGSADLICRMYGIATGVADTTFTADLEISSNDAANPTVVIPVVVRVTDNTVGIETLGQLPTEFDIAQNYPNPFNPTTTIAYQLPKASNVKLVVYNVLGQQVRTLVNNRLEPGRYKSVWDGRNDAGARVGSGIYIYRFEAADFHKVQKMILLK